MGDSSVYRHEDERRKAPHMTYAARESRRFAPFSAWLWLVALVIVGIGVLFTIPTWMVSFDGTSYLALAANLRDFAGYVAPDGTPMTTRGPGYPAVLSLGWLVGEYSSGTAMIVSRLVIVAGGVVAAALAWRLTSSRIAGFAAGLLVVTQPMLLAAGVTSFAPDGLGATLILAAVLALLFILRDDASAWPLLTSGVLVSLAFITKESHALIAIGGAMWLLTRDVPLNVRVRQLGLMGVGFAPVFVAWTVFGITATGELPGALPSVGTPFAWLLVAFIPTVSAFLVVGSSRVPDLRLRLPVGLAAALTFLAVTAITTGIRISGESMLAAPGGMLEIVSTQGYRGATIVGAVVLVAMAAFGWRMIEDRDSASLLVIVVSGTLGLLLFMALTGAVIRNGALPAMLLAVLAGVTLGGARTRRWKLVATGAGVVAVVAAGTIGMVRLSDSIDSDHLTAEAGATVAAAEWLTMHAPGARTTGTPSYYQSVWRLGGERNRNVALLPMYTMSLARWDTGGRSFEFRYDWLGQTATDARRAEALSYSFNDLGVSAVFEEDLVSASASSGYIVVSGNSRYPTSAADGGVVLLLLKDAEGVQPVFVDHSRRAQWIVIFEFVGEFDLALEAPIVRYTDTEPTGLDAPRRLDPVEYSTAVSEAVAQLAAQVPTQPSGR
ncbi:MAG: glycosyltransferase family 39 protein [Actinomycetota bacterium]|nr:glycosyltransferase family 39 protein [Actinomycetota bacterium]MDK1103923.1 glycosyltransferase family 39 protein [Actinomycetota bacterium]